MLIDNSEGLNSWVVHNQWLFLDLEPFAYEPQGAALVMNLDVLHVLLAQTNSRHYSWHSDMDYSSRSRSSAPGEIEKHSAIPLSYFLLAQ